MPDIMLKLKVRNSDRLPLLFDVLGKKSIDEQKFTYNDEVTLPNGIKVKHIMQPLHEAEEIPQAVWFFLGIPVGISVNLVSTIIWQWLSKHDIVEAKIDEDRLEQIVRDAVDKAVKEALDRKEEKSG